MASFDDHLLLMGDEDGGVGINCRTCDRGGAPIAYYEPYPGGPASYVGTDVVIVDSIEDLIAAGRAHAAGHIG